jgi:hypothetical protein
MTDQEIRGMIRESIAKHLGLSPPQFPASSSTGAATLHTNASHVMLPLARGADDDGACIIEPSVRCTHCGYCVSYGH